LCAAGSLAYCSYAMCRSPLLPLFARELGADAPTIGLIVGASTLTGVVVKLPAGAWSDVLGRRALLVTGGLILAVMPFTYLANVGWLFAMQTVTTLATRALIGVMSDRVGRRGLIVTGLLACSTAVWMISSAETANELVTAVLAYAAGVAVTTAATSAYVTVVAPRARYGAAHGVLGTIYDVGDAAGPILAGLLVAAWGYPQMFQVMATMAVAVAAAFYVFSSTAMRSQPDPSHEGARPCEMEYSSSLWLRCA